MRPLCFLPIDVPMSRNNSNSSTHYRTLTVRKALAMMAASFLLLVAWLALNGNGMAHTKALLHVRSRNGTLVQGTSSLNNQQYSNLHEEDSPKSSLTLSHTTTTTTTEELAPIPTTKEEEDNVQAKLLPPPPPLGSATNTAPSYESFWSDDDKNDKNNNQRRRGQCSGQATSTSPTLGFRHQHGPVV